MNSSDNSQIKSILKNVFGHESFRTGQQEIISHIADGGDALGIMPTGAGKSMCYQIPALYFKGITLVISPLISLMSDQVNSLIQSGVAAAYLNSSLSLTQYNAAVNNMCRGRYKIIYVAPERLNTENFLRAAKKLDISMVAVDEAHCISQWGQDFRPQYRYIADFIAALPERPVVCAFTATATELVKKDIITMLRLNNPYTLTTGFDRPNLYFDIRYESDKPNALTSLLEKYRGKSGIIYCSTRKNVESVCREISQKGFSAAPYHAGFPDEVRSKNQNDFIFDRVKIIVATNAFGMGIDKSDVRFVIHYNMPKSIEAYYQEAGRAGRDGEKADCIMLWDTADVRTNEFIIKNSNIENDDPKETAGIINGNLKRLEQVKNLCVSKKCIRKNLLEYFGEKPQFKECRNCSVCNIGFTEKNITIEAQKILSCIYRVQQNGISYGKTVITNILRGSKEKRIAELGFNSLSTYGIMKECSKNYISDIITELVSLKYITFSNDEFHTLNLTKKSLNVLFKGEKVSMRVRSSQEQNNLLSKKQTLRPIDGRLFEKLRAKRSELAEQKGVPAYIIFSDATLRSLCEKLPANSHEFLSVSGVGVNKLKLYGKEFMEVISEHIKNKSAQPKQTEQIFRNIINNRNKIKTKPQNISLEEFSKSISEDINIENCQHEILLALRKWLIQKNYLSLKNSQGFNLLCPTALSEEIFIEYTQKTSASGKEYYIISYPEKAQQKIIENINDIFRL